MKSKFFAVALAAAAFVAVAQPSTASATNNCIYSLGVATFPDGRSVQMDGIDEEGESTLEAKGYKLGTVYKADLVLFIRSQAQYRFWVLGSVATAVMRDVISQDTVATGVGTFAPAPEINVISALKALPPCKAD